MKHITSKLLSLLLTLAMLMSMVPAAYAADIDESADVGDSSTSEDYTEPSISEDDADYAEPQDGETEGNAVELADTAETTYVAEIAGGEQYETLKAAVDAASTGDTINVLTDIDLGSGNVKFYNTDVENLTFDLNGHTITTATTSSTGYAVAAAHDGLVIKNGTISNTSTKTSLTSCAVYVTNAGTTTLENVTLTAKGSGIYVSLNTGAATINIEDGTDISGGKYGVYLKGSNGKATYDGSETLNVAGGKIAGSTAGVYVAGPGTTSAATSAVNVNITDGEVESVTTTGSANRTASVNISGGTITGAVKHNGADKISITGGTIEGNVTNASSGTLTITNGTFNGTLTSSGSGTTAVTGGKFDSDVSQYVPDGYTYDASTGEVTEGTSSVTYAAQIGETKYKTLVEALDAVQAGETITLTSDVDFCENSTYVILKNCTLDLNGHSLKLSNTNDKGNFFIANATFTLKDSTDTNKDGTGTGKIYTETPYARDTASATLIQAANFGHFIMESGLIDAASFTSDPSNVGQFAVGVYNNQPGSDASVTINGGHIKAGWYAIAGNGAAATANNVVGNITVTGGIVESVADYAIYHPQVGTTTITGGVVSGAGGAVAIRRGALNITGGVVTSKGQSSTGEWGDGTSGLKNAAIISNANVGDVTVTISGGKITADGDAVILSSSATGHESTIAVSGGEFNQQVPEEYCEAGYVPTQNEDGTYSVAKPKVAQIGDTKYESLTDALAAAQTGETVKLLSDITIDGEKGLVASVATGVTFDLNGYTIDGSSVSLKSTAPAALVLTVGYVRSSWLGEFTLTNSGSAGGITAQLPLRFNCSGYADAVKITIDDSVKLTVQDGGENAVHLNNSPLYLVATDTTKSFYKNGGFLAVASEGDERIYESLGGAKTANKTVTLLNDYTTASTLKIWDSWGNVTLDLNGHTYESTAKSGNTFELQENSNITFKNGTLKGAAASVVGCPYDNTTLILDGVTVEATGYGVATNGSNSKNTVTIKNGSVIKSSNDVGVFFPSGGTLTIENSTIEGKTGVQIYAGSLKISDATITATGDSTGAIGGDGSILDGAAVSIVNREGYKGLDTIEITSGTFTAASGIAAIQAYGVESSEKTGWTDVGDTVSVSGGTFSAVPSNMVDLCSDGVGVTKETDGTFKAVTGVVAQLVDENGNAISACTDLYDALTADEAKAILLTDITNCNWLIEMTRYSNTRVLDLNGHNITFAGNAGIVVFGTGSSAVSFEVTGEGTISAPDNELAPIRVEGAKWDDGTVKLTIGENVTLSGTSGLMIDSAKPNSHGNDNYGITVNIAGTVKSTAYGYAVYVNGSITEQQPVINVKGTAKIEADGWGMYLAGNNKTTVESGAAISGTVTGIEIRAGELTLDGCTVTGGNGTTTATGNGNGATVANAAVAISQHTTKLPVSVTIKGGTFNSTTALYQANTLTDKTDFDDIALSVTGGTFTGDVKSDNKTGFISKPADGNGPLFSAKPADEYCALGYTAAENDDGAYALTERTEAAAMFDADGNLLGYAEVAEALDNSSAVTVKLINDAKVDDETFTVVPNKTIDLNGKNLTVTGKISAFGAIIDSTDGNGLLIVGDMDGAQLPASNGYLPVKDGDGYRLYSYALEVFTSSKTGLKYSVLDNGAVKFAVSLSFANSEAWQKIAADDNSVKLFYTAEWADEKALFYFESSVLDKAATLNPASGKKLYFTMTVSGFDKLSANTVFTMTPSLESAFYSQQMDSVTYTIGE